MKNHVLNISLFFASLFVLSCSFSSCKEEPITISNEKGLSRFYLSHAVDTILNADVEGIINQETGEITLHIPQQSINLEKLTAHFEVEGFCSVTIGSVFQESGKTMNNFYNVLNYTVKP